MGFNYIPCSVQCLHFCAIWTRVLRMWGNQTCWDRFSIATDPGWMRWKLSGIVCINCVGITILSSMSKQSSLTCSLFLIMCQYCPYDTFIASQSLYLTIFMSGWWFRSFFVAAAMKRTPSTRCNFFLNSGVSSSASVLLVAFFNFATSPSVIDSWLASCWVFDVIVGVPRCVSSPLVSSCLGPRG